MTDDTPIPDSPNIGFAKDLPKLYRRHSSRLSIQAGDLHTSSAGNDSYRPFGRSFSFIGSVKRPERTVATPLSIPEVPRLSADDFDLREEVMSCIAKSIGLHQPPLSGSDSVDASPTMSATDVRSNGARTRSPPGFNSFGSLSLLETGDDMSSVTGDSVTGTGNISALDNEVEILFFAAGSTLAQVGEQHPGKCPLYVVHSSAAEVISGLFYVIDGILDISAEVEDDDRDQDKGPFDRSQPRQKGRNSSAASDSTAREEAPTSPSSKPRKHLFSVNPGGIAGYMGVCIPHRRHTTILKR